MTRDDRNGTGGTAKTSVLLRAVGYVIFAIAYLGAALGFCASLLLGHVEASGRALQERARLKVENPWKAELEVFRKYEKALGRGGCEGCPIAGTCLPGKCTQIRLIRFTTDKRP
jgi:hypothetical protein